MIDVNTLQEGDRLQIVNLSDCVVIFTGKICGKDNMFSGAIEVYFDFDSGFDLDPEHDVYNGEPAVLGLFYPEELEYLT